MEKTTGKAVRRKGKSRPASAWKWTKSCELGYAQPMRRNQAKQQRQTRPGKGAVELKAVKVRKEVKGRDGSTAHTGGSEHREEDLRRGHKAETANRLENDEQSESRLAPRRIA